jgi:putative glutamine amidotransferase
VGRPVIGITAALESAGWSVWAETEVNLSPRTYSECVADGGGLPLLLPADERSADDPSHLLDLLDGLVLAGGADLDPASYGAEPHPRTVGYKAERDRFELALCREAFERDLPTLGICRGMQLMNVARGGDIVQHLGDGTPHVEKPGEFSSHGVRLDPGSLAARVVDCDHIEVRSHHHQALGELGEGVVPSGWSAFDDLIEAIEVPGLSFCVAVLWHPEEVGHVAPFRALADAARQAVAM